MGNIYFLTYENSGKAPLNGNFEVELYDDEGNQYPEKKHIIDIAMEPIQPGATSEARFVEAAVVPKDTKITSFKVFIAGQPTTYEIP